MGRRAGLAGTYVAEAARISSAMQGMRKMCCALRASASPIHTLGTTSLFPAAAAASREGSPSTNIAGGSSASHRSSARDGGLRFVERDALSAPTDQFLSGADKCGEDLIPLSESTLGTPRIGSVHDSAGASK